jgi:transposase
MFQYRQVLVRLRAGDTLREIARTGLMGRDKIGEVRALALSRGWLDSAAELPDDAQIVAALKPARRAVSTVSSVEPFREVVGRWAEMGVQSRAIHAALAREHGFTGSYSAVVRMVRALGALRPPELTVRLSFAPAEAAQVDFGAGPVLRHPDGTARRTWAFVMTLCHSRHQYVEFVWDQSSATWLGCHRRAFEWFDGVPERVIVDNAKCAIVQACRHDPMVQRAYAECAEGYGFRIEPCPPHDPQKKGIVESGVKYLKGNFLPTRSFRDLPDLNQQARDWVMREAGVRIHGTTREQPLALFELERPLMRRLPAIPPDLGAWQRSIVHRDCHIQLARAYYSAPFTLVGQTLWVRVTDAAVTLYQDYRHLYTHPRARRPGERITHPEHMPPDARSFFEHDRRWCHAQAQAIGAHCAALIEQLLGERVAERLRAAQSVIALARQFGDKRLDAACQRAIAHNSPRYITVKTILATGADLQPDPGIDTPSAYRATRFTRSAADLFSHAPNDTVH